MSDSAIQYILVGWGIILVWTKTFNCHSLDYSDIQCRHSLAAYMTY